MGRLDSICIDVRLDGFVDAAQAQGRHPGVLRFTAWYISGICGRGQKWEQQ